MRRRRPGKSSSQQLKAVLGIRDMLFSGKVEPGERLSEITIAERLGLSRTPVRAALARLDQEGLVEAIPSGGYTARRFSQEDIADAIELRGVLEGTAARLAAERGVAPARLAAAHALLADLDGIVARPPAELDMEAYIDRNAAFHLLLKGMSSSRTVQREIDRVLSLPFADPSAFINVQMELASVRESLFVAQAQHRAIISAIEMRESARAEALAREHARLARQNLDAVMENRRLIDRVPGLRLVSS